MLKTPRDYQLIARDYICGAFPAALKGRAIIADEMGLGKTGEILIAWKQLDPELRWPVLIVAGKNAQYQWLSQTPMWLENPPRLHIIQGTAPKRQKQWKKLANKTLGTNYVACTRAVLIRDLASGWVPKEWFLLISDEAHKDSNRKTKSFEALKALTSKYLLLATGSAVRKGPQDLWALLHLLDRKRFSSYWKYIGEYCNVQRNEFGGTEILGPKPGSGYKEMIAKYMLRRRKVEVMPELPPKQRIFVPVDMTPIQEKMYNTMLEEAILEFEEGEGGLSVASTALVKLTRLRQILMSPKILNPLCAEDGGSIDWLMEKLDEADSDHMAIFMPYTSLMPIVKARLIKEGHVASSIVELRGGLDAEALGREIDRFVKTKGIALVSIKFAEAFDLVPATWGCFLGYEWDVMENLQAEDRLHRSNIFYPVDIYYPQHKGTVDESVMQTLDGKTVSIKASLHNIDSIRKMLREAQQLRSLK